MEFALHYRGELRPNGKAAHKHSVRRKFHKQMKRLFAEKDSLLQYLPKDQIDWATPFGAFNFVSLVCERYKLLAELEITLLRPQAPDGIRHGGDIDNRLKTLFDAMRIPQSEQEVPSDEKPDAEETPLFYCVLEDDRRITKVTIHTERLWEPANSADEVELIMLVRPVRMYGFI